MLIISDYCILGDQISEEKVKIMSQRVLDVKGGKPTIETSFFCNREVWGLETTATVYEWHLENIENKWSMIFPNCCIVN